MEQDKLRFNLTPESALLEKTLRDRHRYSTTEEQKHEKNTFGWSAKCKDFTAEEGKRQIGEYINTWDLQPCWVYSLDFLCSNQDEDHSVFYHYRARFSTPTPQRPIQGTASVYFTVAVFKVEPQAPPPETPPPETPPPEAPPLQALHLEVAFVIESCRFVHKPGETTFREERLVEVVQNKTLLRGAVDV